MAFKILLFLRYCQLIYLLGFQPSTDIIIITYMKNVLPTKSKTIKFLCHYFLNLYLYMFLMLVINKICIFICGYYVNYVKVLYVTRERMASATWKINQYVELVVSRYLSIRVYYYWTFLFVSTSQPSLNNHQPAFPPDRAGGKNQLRSAIQSYQVKYLLWRTSITITIIILI